MITKVNLVGMEKVDSNAMGVPAYRVDFDLVDGQGPYGSLPSSEVKGSRSSLSAFVSIEVPVDHTTESDVFSVCRDTLRHALLRLADAAMRPPQGA